MSNYRVVDYLTKKEVSPDSFVFAGDKDPWEIVVDLEEVKSNIDISYFRKAPPFQSKYLPFMPVADHRNFVSLQEGATPLIPSKHIGPTLGVDLYFKHEGKNPTGSFKDRGSALELTVVKELGAKGIVVASTGNMAASCSCYAAAAKVPCYVFVPENTPPSKLSQAISYGGNIVQVRGSYNDAAQLAVEVAKEFNFYLAGDYAFRVEGQKCAAFELMDQLYYRIPDYVLVPIGCGTNMAGYHKGFNEYKELGFISDVPKLVGTQAAGANSVERAFLEKEERVSAVPVDTFCSAIGISEPIDGSKALRAAYDTGGTVLSSTDTETLEALYMLSKEEGIFCEASCATAVAALLKLAAKEDIKGKKIVCVITGDGLKDPTPVLKAAIKPPTIYPSCEEFRELSEAKFFDGNTISFIPGDKALFPSVPTDSELLKVLKDDLNVELRPELVARVKKGIEIFVDKGKAVNFSDLQDIVQTVFESPSSKSESKLKVLDYEVVMSKSGRPKSKVKVMLGGKEKQAEADGVGPFDSIMAALKKCLSSEEFRLADYRVDIRSKGTDAVVTVEIKLERSGQTSVGRVSSPDIIQASVEAFQTAFNG